MWSTWVVHTGMSDMAKPTGLARRKGTYYFRIRVPKDLVSVFGKKEIRKSLETTDYGKAKKRRNQMAIEWDARFAQARKTVDQSASVTAEPLTQQQAVRLVQDYVEQMDGEWRRRKAEHYPSMADERREMIIEHAMSEQTLKDPEDPRRDREIWLTSQKILERSGLELGEDSIPYVELWELVRRALLELDRRAQARLVDDFSASHFDQLFSHRPSSNAINESPPFGSLCDQYFNIYTQDATTRKIHQQRIDKVKAHLGLVREIIGEHTPVAAIDYDRCLTFRETLAKVPARRKQFYGDKPLKEVIVAAEKAGKPTMGYVTQAGYLATLTRVLELGRRKKLFSDVPSEGLVPIAKKVADEEKRDPFTMEQLHLLFHSEYYAMCAQHGNRPYLNTDKPGRFWLPIISLFTGMRPKEICQMHVADLKVSDEGIPFFHVIADDEGKTEKTPTSRRKIPVHPELIRMGFLDYLESVREQEHQRLFPELKKNKYGNYSAYILRRFREKFLPDAIHMSEKQSYYSFRHCFRDALRRIEAPAEILQSLGAWSQGKLVSDAYGAGFEIGHLMKYVEMIEYPGLDLTHLYVKDGGG